MLQSTWQRMEAGGSDELEPSYGHRCRVVCPKVREYMSAHDGADSQYILCAWPKSNLRGTHFFFIIFGQFISSINSKHWLLAEKSYCQTTPSIIHIKIVSSKIHKHTHMFPFQFKIYNIRLTF